MRQWREKLPASKVDVTCSGRDDMCRPVLNDEWVLHPTWSNEYDFHIEAVMRTILSLSTTRLRSSPMKSADRSS